MKIDNKLKINVLSFGFLQIFNFLITLSALSYLVRILGANIWGHIVFTQIVINYGVWIVNWGFYFGATKRVSENRENKLNLDRVFSETWSAQWLIAFLILIVAMLVFFMYEKKIPFHYFYICSLGLFFGNLITPLWFYNGLELIKEAAFLQILVKAMALPAIFLLVKNHDDGYLYLSINSISSIIVGFISLYWLFRKKLVSFLKPNFYSVLSVLKLDFQLFLNCFWATLNSSIIPTLLGILGTSSDLAYYNVAERARSAAITVLHPISHALFPRMCYLYSNNANNANDANELLKKSGLLIFLLAFLLSVALYVFSNKIILLLPGEHFLNSIAILKVLSISAFFTTASAFFINQFMIPTGMYSEYTKSILFTSLLSCIISYPLISMFSGFGASLVILVAEAFLALVLVFFVVKKRKGIFFND